MNFIKRNKAYFIAPAIVVLILCVVFIVKGVYPFGDRSIAYYDMPICYIPLYTHTYDFLHGNAPVLLDWYNAAASDVTYNSTTYVLNPFNLLLYFTSRDNIMYFMSIILMIKLAASALTMTLYIKKKHNTSDLYTVIMSLMYALCGFTFNDYMNIFFLDLMILLPALMLALDHMIKTRKALPYTILSFAAITLSFYLSAMTYIYVILYIFGYILFIEKDKMKRRHIAADVGIYTIIGAVMAVGLVLPAVIKTAQSPRMGYIPSYGEILTTRNGDFDDQKLFMLFGSEFALSILLILIIKCIRSKEKPDAVLSFNIYRMILFLVPIISEGSDMLWHLGSYAHFPYRFGFLLAFTGVDILAGFNSEHKSEKPYFQIKKPKLARAAEYGAISISICSVILFSIIAYLLRDTALYDHSNYNNATIRTYRIVLPLMVLSGLLIFGLCNKKMRAVLFTGIVVLQTSLGCYGFIAPANDNSNYVVDFSTSAYGSLDIPQDNLSRIKFADAESNIMNFPMLSGYAGLTDWTLDPTSAYLEEMRRLGYAYVYTACYDMGGSLFSDALLNVKMIGTINEFDDDSFYKYSEGIRNYNFYNCNYTIPFGILADNDLSAIPDSGDISPFEEQNNIYRAISDNGDIFTYDSLDGYDIDYRKDIVVNFMLPFTYSFDVDIKGNALIYAYSSSEDLVFTFMVNEEPKAFIEDRGAAQKDKDMISNGQYQTVELGKFRDETVKLSLITNTDEIEDLYIGILDLDKLGELCDKYNAGDHAYDVEAEGTELTLKVDYPDGRWLFLPIEYNDKWKATINGSSAEITPVMDGAFIGIKLGSEDADIKLKFVPEMQYRCIFITIAGILLLIAVVFMDKKGHRLSDVKFLNGTAIVLFSAAAVGLLIVLYAAPIVGNIVSFFI